MNQSKSETQVVYSVCAARDEVLLHEMEMLQVTDLFSI